MPNPSSTDHLPGGGRRLLLLAPLALPLLALPASAHHLMEILQLPPTPAVGLLSGLAHPLLGPDHLLFLLALSLVGLRHRASWMLGLLGTGLAGSAAGLLLPGLPGAEALVAATLVVVALVLLDRLPRVLLLPAFALHGYVLSAAVLGWTFAPVGAYLVGLLVSQGTLLLVSLTLLRRGAARLTPGLRQGLAAALLGCGAAWAWSGLVG
jgi:urease accessory protein